MPGKKERKELQRKELRRMREQAEERQRARERPAAIEQAAREADAAVRRAIDVAPGAPPQVRVMAGDMVIEGAGFGIEPGVFLMGGWVAPVAMPDANTKARATLLRFLNKEQRESLEKTRRFELISSGGNRYRIDTTGSASGSVCWMVDGKMAGQYCAYPSLRGYDRGVLPKDDQFLGQMLQLITDENSYLDKANVFAGTYPPSYYSARGESLAARAEPGCACAHCCAARANLGQPQPAAAQLGDVVGEEIVVQIERQQLMPGMIRTREIRVDRAGVQRTYTDGRLTDTVYPNNARPW